MLRKMMQTTEENPNSYQEHEPLTPGIVCAKLVSATVIHFKSTL